MDQVVKLSVAEEIAARVEAYKGLAKKLIEPERASLMQSWTKLQSMVSILTSNAETFKALDDVMRDAAEAEAHFNASFAAFKVLDEGLKEVEKLGEARKAEIEATLKEYAEVAKKQHDQLHAYQKEVDEKRESTAKEVAELDAKVAASRKTLSDVDKLLAKHR